MDAMNFLARSLDSFLRLVVCFVLGFMEPNLDSGLSDVWDHLHIVTSPDKRTGRRGSIISACKSAAPVEDSCISLPTAPLKTLGYNMDVPVDLIPVEKKDFRSWKARSTYMLLSMYLN
jgi:hypothetical protein